VHAYMNYDTRMKPKILREAPNQFKLSQLIEAKLANYVRHLVLLVSEGLDLDLLDASR